MIPIVCGGSLMNINGRQMRTSETKISPNISKYMYAFS